MKWKERDPIILFEDSLLRDGYANQEYIEEINVKVRQEVEEAFKFAENSPFPLAKDAYTDLYSN